MNTDNIVMMGKFNTKISDLQILYECLTIHYVDYTVGMKLEGMGRETVPFFGHNDVIIGLKYGTTERGIKRKKGHLPNLIGVDYQSFNKNFNIKISRESIQLTGAKSEQMGEDVIDNLMIFFNMINEIVIKIIELDCTAKSKILKWINAMFIRNDHLLYLDECINLIDQHFTQDRDILYYLSTFIVDFSDYKSYIKKIEYLFSINTPPLMEKIYAEEKYICNGVYSTFLDANVSLIDLSKYLSTIVVDGHQKYITIFHNWNSRRQLIVIVPIEFNSDDRKIHAHRFRISRKGCIRQYSPTTSDEAIKYHDELVADISSFINQV